MCFSRVRVEVVGGYIRNYIQSEKGQRRSVLMLVKRVFCSLLYLESHLNSISNLNLLGLFSTERGKRDLEN